MIRIRRLVSLIVLAGCVALSLIVAETHLGYALSESRTLDILHLQNSSRSGEATESIATPLVWAGSLQYAQSPAAEESLNRLILEGRDRYQAGAFREAEQIWRSVVEQSGTDLVTQGIVWRYLATTYEQLGNWNQANDAIAASFATLGQYQGNDAIQLLAQSLTTQGHLQLAQGQATAALATWEAAEEQYQHLNDETGIFGSRINQARAMQVLGLYRRARAMLTELHVDLERLADPELQVMGRRQLGNALRVVGDLETSQLLLEQSLAIASQHDLIQEQSLTLISLGITFQVGNNPDAAMSAYQQAQELSSNPATQLQAQVQQTSLLFATNRAEEGRSQLLELVSDMATLTPSRTVVYARIQLAYSWLEFLRQQSRGAGVEHSDDYRAVAEFLAIAVEQAQALGDPRAESYTLGYLGQVYEQTGQWAIAEELTQQALLLASQVNASDILYQWQWQMGRLYLAQGNNEQAIASYDSALNSLNSLKSDLVATSVDVQASFQTDVEPVYRELLILLLGQEGDYPSLENLQQARLVIESLQLAELENFFREACVDVAPVNVDEVDTQAAVAYPIVLPDRIAIILSLPGQPLQYSATFQPEDETLANINDLRQSLRRTAFESEYLPASQQVYDILVRPWATDLANSGVDTIVFALDSPLQNIPVSALHNGQRYLIEDYNIAFTPGLQLLTPQPIAEQELTALIGALSEGSQGFAPLPAVEQEVNQIVNEIPANVLLNEEFTRDRIQRQINANPVPIIHLATHGQFSSSAEDTFLLTWDDRINVRQLDALLSSRDLVDPRPIELLILSACQTAAGDRRAALGLAGIAIRSGARSTLATLWLVNDQATADLIQEFYKALSQNTLTKAQALRQAQLSLLSIPRYRHPYYWAAFVLLGNWL